jgi:type II secretory ATPase GspE/PulE/Tfp pilus assembly ATPase PilB-like protein
MAEVDEKNSVDLVVDEALYPDPLNTFILNAIYEQATDIHLNVVDGGMLVLFRVDGIVHEKRRLSQREGRKLLNQIKAAAGVSASKSLAAPQEGQMRWRDDNQRDKNIRVTIVPMDGEECGHLRILSMPEKELEIANLGFSDEHMTSITESLDSLSGLILVAGITGSGKTTTMYSMVSSRDLSSLVAFSIEDPVEFRLPNSQQLEVNEDHGLTMYQGLRTILQGLGNSRRPGCNVGPSRAGHDPQPGHCRGGGRTTLSGRPILHYQQFAATDCCPEADQEALPGVRKGSRALCGRK